MKTPKKAPLLKMQGATVVKNGRRILDDITLEISQGEHSVMLGPNGAGKSSLIRLITRQDYPLAHPDGTPALRIFGESLWNVFELRTLMGIISEELQVSFISRSIPGRTRGLDAVLSGFFASYGVFPHQTVTEAMQERAYEVLDLMEARHLAPAYIETMSTGEARRLMIARALVTNPAALMLDEPTAGLDLPARQRFLGNLQKIARHGKTIILVTHRVEEIFPEINRVILLKQGRILLDSSKKEALTSEHLSALFEAPITVHQHHGYYSAVCGVGSGGGG
jgi:iron complex transport system ATP-binding protein